LYKINIVAFFMLILKSVNKTKIGFCCSLDCYISVNNENI
jgi:hypothetical protein